MDCISITADQLAQTLQKCSQSHVLLLDLRSFMSFSQVHLLASINICIPLSILKRKNFSLGLVESAISCEKAKERFRNRAGAQVVIYDADCSKLSTNNAFNCIVQKLLEENLVHSVCFLEGGFKAIQERFPQFCLFKSQSPKSGRSPAQTPLLTTTSTYHHDREPVQILDYLYIGNQEVASCQEVLEKHNITYILNAAEECKDAFTENPKFHYKRLNLLDHASQNLNYELFKEAFQFIDEARNAGAKVLVHCKAGQSRSATILITYLIYTNRWTLQQTYRFVQEKRPSISPNLGFMSQIVQFEKIELGNATCMSQIIQFEKIELGNLTPIECK